MKKNRLWIVLVFMGLSGVAYTATIAGWGASPFKNHQTMEEVKKNCPNGYKNQNGDCMKTTFRSIWFMRAGSSSYGSGK